MSSVVIPAAARTEAAEAPTESAARLQHLPCRIEHRGPAQVDQFFTPLVRHTAPGVLEGQFRGHPLDGSTVALPAGYEGVVVRAEPQADGTRYVATETFRQFTSWNWDRKASANDPTARLQHWFDLADVLHSTTEDN